MKAACGVSMLVGVLVACGDSETTTDGTGGNTTNNGGNGGTPSTGGNGGTPSAGGNGGEGGSPATRNGCTRAGATDETGNATVTLPAWSIPFASCIVVDTATDVTWNGDFTFHPLTGGETFSEDANSPITGNTPANNSVTISFPDAGEYPYYCTNHGSSMQGVIYVE